MPAPDAPKNATSAEREGAAEKGNRPDRRLLHIAWLLPVLLPLPALVFNNPEDDNLAAQGLFFIGCAVFASCVFRPDMHRDIARRPENGERLWHDRLRVLAGGLLAAYVVFTILSLIFDPAHRAFSWYLAFTCVVPSFCVIPYLILATRKPLAATVFGLFLVICMKLLGCVVVVLVYGWHTSEHGYTDMPWAHPNLLVWLFWSFTAVLSLVCYPLGAAKFRSLMQTG